MDHKPLLWLEGHSVLFGFYGISVSSEPMESNTLKVWLFPFPLIQLTLGKARRKSNYEFLQCTRVLPQGDPGSSSFQPLCTKSGLGIDWEAVTLFSYCEMVWKWKSISCVRLFATAWTISVQFSCSVVSNSLRPHESQHARPPCPSPAPGVHPNPCALSRWCHPTISSSVIPFSSCPQSLPPSGSFQMSQFFASGGQAMGVSASTSVLPMNTQDWSPLGWTGWISLQSKGLSRVFYNTTVQKHQFFCTQLSL